MKKLGIITTHPIQYQIPLFKRLKEKKILPLVFFASKHGINNRKDHEFLQKLKWDINKDILKGYQNFFPKKQRYEINDFRIRFENIEKIFLKEKIKYILVFGWNNLHYLSSIYYAYKHNIKIILRVETNLNSTKSYFKNLLKKIFLKYFFKMFSNFLVIGKLNKEFYLYHKVPSKKLSKGLYFVDNDFFRLNNSKKKLKKKYKFHKKKIVLFVGKFIQRKNPLEFLKLAKLFDDKKDIKFIMIGDGNLKNKCHQYIKKNKLNNTRILGFINQKKIREYYWISDLLIVPSKYETWGLNINEAFASDTPVICTKNCGASADLLHEGGLVLNTMVVIC